MPGRSAARSGRGRDHDDHSKIRRGSFKCEGTSTSPVIQRASVRDGRGRGRGRSRGEAIQADADGISRSPWRYSKAKAKLAALLKDPTSWVQSLTPAEIHARDPVFRCYPEHLFKPNCARLKETINLESNAINFEETAFTNERQLFPRDGVTCRGKPFWDTHQAKILLEADLKAGTTLKPKDLRGTRDEYKDFSLPDFTKHVHQERSRQLSTVAWQHRRNKTARQQHDKEVTQLQKEALDQNA